MAAAATKIWAWEKDSYVVSTDSSLVDLDALTEVWASDVMPWARTSDPETMKAIVENCLCLGLYLKRSDESDLQLVGSARVITDYITFGYLTDVYVLPSHQGKGLGAWMMRCLNEILDSWPLLRRFIILTASPDAARLYNRTLGAQKWQDMEPDTFFCLQKKGKAVIDQVTKSKEEA